MTLQDPDGRAPTPSTSATTSEHFINRLPTSFHEMKTDDWGELNIKRSEAWNQKYSRDFKRETHYTASKLGPYFTLYSTSDFPSKQLIVTAHGFFDLNSKAVPIPDGVTLEFLNPHDTILREPGIDHLAMYKKYTLYSISNHHLKSHNKFAVEQKELLGIWAVTGEDNDIKAKAAENDKNSVINITNYSLLAYEHDTPDRIGNALAVNRAITQTIQDQTVRTDIVTVSDTVTIDGVSKPLITTIRELFNELKANDIHYDNIVCSFCRCERGNEKVGYDPATASLYMSK
ncbi:hypothetical protein I4619_18830 [Proteus alimentorum]|nr:hypothetical protein [Proteus alimentorum]